jgi:nucleoside-diphosphate-sugar epimerase
MWSLSTACPPASTGQWRLRQSSFTPIFPTPPTSPDIIKTHGVEAIIHFAGSISVPESIADPLGYYQNNTANSLALIRTAVATGVRKFVFSSTAAVYGTPQSDAADRRNSADPSRNRPMAPPS